MLRHSWIPMLAWLAGCLCAAAQGARNGPRIGYLYPAGACRGSTVEILAGGQNLRAVKDVRVSGNGVHARIVKTYRPLSNLDGDQRALLQWHVACRRAEINDTPPPPEPQPAPGPDGKPAPKAELPENPLVDLLGAMDAARIEHWLTVMKRIDRMQPNTQLGELARVEIKLDADAAPGIRELRFNGKNGLTNPLRFEVATLPEIQECEPNEETPETSAARVPCTFNGQIQSGDADRFLFHARRGQNLLVKGQARSLIPYLADAVPGWFQMVISVKDAKGNELAYCDDFRFDPDPVFCVKIPDDGDYVVETRDSIYRGREDFVYRISIGELPFITSAFPLGGREGEPLTTTVRGWNLPRGSLKLDTSPGGDSLRTVKISGKSAPSNELSYAVDTLPEITETEDGNDASAVPFPCIVNGRIDKPGDTDIFRIEGRKGMEIIAEVQARRLRSPLDSVIHIADEHGTVLAWNDDLMEKDGHLHLGDGLLTHHADSRARVTLSADGPVFVRIADTAQHGGSDHAYRLRLCGVRPDFELRVTPSAVNMPPGTHVPLRVHVLRSDGFEGPIQLRLDGAPPGFRISGGTIPADAREARITLIAPAQGAGGISTPRLTGSVDHENDIITRVAQPADDMMQAFLWRHLVPAREWLVCVTPGRGGQAPLDVDCPLPLRVPAGGSAEVRIRLTKWIADQGMDLELSEAPPGIGISTTRSCPGGLAFDVTADPAMVKPGFGTNLILQAAIRTKQAGKTKGKAPQRPMFTGLPAIPIIVIPPVQP